MATTKRKKGVVGWKEHAGLPDLKIKDVVAKIDTGATLSSIHASDIKITTKAGVKYVSFKVMKRNNTVKKLKHLLLGIKELEAQMVMLRDDH